MHYRLGERQTEGEVTITLGAQTKSLRLSNFDREDSVTFDLSPGRHSYALKGQTRFQDKKGTFFRRPFGGSGEIDGSFDQSFFVASEGDLVNAGLAGLSYTARLVNYLVGTWRADVNQFEITWNVGSDGSYTFKAKSGGQVTGDESGSWRNAGGVVYLTPQQGLISSGSISWVNRNYFVLTILDNGNQAEADQKRHYHRQAQ